MLMRLTAEENHVEQLKLESELQLHKCKAERAYQQLKSVALLQMLICLPLIFNSRFPHQSCPQN